VAILTEITGVTMRVAVLASGGKDSAYAAWWAQLQGWEVVSLVTVLVKGDDSMMFQLQNTWITAFQASSSGVPWKPIISFGEEEEEIGDLESSITAEGYILDFNEIFPPGIEIPENLVIHNGPLDIDGLVVGALRSDYQKTRIERMCQRLGIASFSPLWHKDQGEHMQSFLEHGFGVVFTSVSTEGMSADWVGRTLDGESLNELRDLSKRHRFNLDGEGGEFETIVVSAPHMRRDVILEGETFWKGSRGSLEILSCRLS
tara:strand:- start:3757 stop:4533 length:777 start_codon:yes stop_codon:yes gene_type:complete